MPARWIREGILSSDRVDQLDDAAEVFYRRLMSKVDDYGFFDARPSMLRASLYPLRVDRVSDEQLLGWLTQCINAGLLLLYQVHGKTYLQLLDTRWSRRSEPKFPKPTSNCKQLRATANPITIDVVRSTYTKDVDVDVERATTRAPHAPPSPSGDGVARGNGDRAPAGDRPQQKSAFKKMPEKQGATPEHLAKQRRIAALIVDGKFDEAKKLRDE